MVPAVHSAAAQLDSSLSLDSQNDKAKGIWSDGTTMWVAEHSYSAKLFAYNLSTGARDSAKDIARLNPAANHHATGLWSDGTTIWVADSRDDKIYAYDLASGSRQSGSDINDLDDAGNTHARGIWSDGTTMWVADISGRQDLRVRTRIGSASAEQRHQRSA